MGTLSGGQGKIMKIASVLILGTAIASLIWTLWGFTHPPFTDDQIKSNMVDTWEAHILGSFVIEIAESLAMVACAIAAFFSRRPLRWRFVVAAILFSTSIGLEMSNANTLTHRTEKLTGSDLSQR